MPPAQKQPIFHAVSPEISIISTSSPSITCTIQSAIHATSSACIMHFQLILEYECKIFACIQRHGEYIYTSLPPRLRPTLNSLLPSLCERVPLHPRFSHCHYGLASSMARSTKSVLSLLLPFIGAVILLTSTSAEAVSLLAACYICPDETSTGFPLVDASYDADFFECDYGGTSVCIYSTVSFVAPFDEKPPTHDVPWLLLVY
jgi:hypothetical protein